MLKLDLESMKTSLAASTDMLAVLEILELSVSTLPNHEKYSGSWEEVTEKPWVFLVELFEFKNSKLFSGVQLSSESYLTLKQTFWEIRQ